jgi:peptidoglycan/xylan/chitin deacetylase (PgdA/CDA1 family)
MTPPADILGFTAPAAACGLASAALLAHGTFAPASTFWGPVISRAPQPCPPHVAITFDDGPGAGSTARILDLLGEHDVSATFFVVGRNAQRHPKLVERMHADGHVVANHTWDHAHFGLFRRDGYWRAQVARTDDVIEHIIGHRPALFRPPMGIKTWHITAAAVGAGHSVVTWTRRALDGVATQPERIVARLVPTSRRGDILLLHDGAEPSAPRRDSRATEAALRPLILGLRDRGLEPKRLDTLLGLRPYQERRAGEKQPRSAPDPRPVPSGAEVCARRRT